MDLPLSSVVATPLKGHQMDINKFLVRWYGKTAIQLRESFNLLKASNAGIPPSLTQKCQALSTSRIIGATENLEFLLRGESILTGGPCIDDCYEDISIESVHDIASLIQIGKVLQKKVIIHIGVQEEILRRKQSDRKVKQWQKMGLRFENLIKNLKQKMDYSNVICLCSDKPTVDFEITRFANQIQMTITEDDAQTLYRHLNGNKDYPSNDLFNFNIHTRFLALYLPEFIEAALGLPKTRLLIYEDIQQLLAVKKGNALTILRNRLDSGPSQIVTMPYPSIDAKTRMHRSKKDYKPYLNTPNQKLREIIYAMTEETFEYNQRTWPLELTNKEIQTREDLIKFMNELKQYDSAVATIHSPNGKKRYTNE